MKFTVIAKTSKGDQWRGEVVAEGVDDIIPALERIGEKKRIEFTDITGVEPHSKINRTDL